MKVDDTIFLNYILSVIEGDEPREEKMEILQSILIDTGSLVSEFANSGSYFQCKLYSM